jgi:hypothetical protein
MCLPGNRILTQPVEIRWKHLSNLRSSSRKTGRVANAAGSLAVSAFNPIWNYQSQNAGGNDDTDRKQYR